MARELLAIRGWKPNRPPKGHLLWKNEYRDYPELTAAFAGRGKKGHGGDAYPDFMLLDPETLKPMLVGETKAEDADIGKAIHEASDLYGEALVEHDMNVLAAGVAGNDRSNIEVVVKKRALKEWKPIQYRDHPIQWLPTPDETKLLLQDLKLFDLQPQIPSPQILATRADDINGMLRECTITDAERPAVMGAFMLGLWQSKGMVRLDVDHVLSDINQACQQAFIMAGKRELANSILVNEKNDKLAAKAAQLCHILRLLGITTLTAEHDYLGQLYEAFFRFTGGNTIGQYFTPRHITKFMTELVEVSPADYVVDPACGTGGFLISSLYRMMGNRSLTKLQLNQLVSEHLKGFESEPKTAALCVANMILRGDGTTGIVKGDSFTNKDFPIGEASIVLGNPPFPHKKGDLQPEKFVDRGLEALEPRGELAMILPMKMLNDGGKSRWRKKTLENNSLRAVITLPSELFQPYASSTTTIAVMEKGIPHEPKKPTFFCQIENDGLKMRKRVRLPIPGEQLTGAMTAYRNGTSTPKFCTWKSLSRNALEWSPGAFIESLPVGAGELEKSVAWLLRSLVSFHSFHADHLSQLQHEIADGICKPVPFREIRKGKTTHLGSRPDHIGTLFDVWYGQHELETKKGLRTGNVPVISSAGTQNGCFGFFDFSDKAPVVVPPFVSVPRTGSIGEAFVQVTACGVTSDCLVLVPKKGTTIGDLFVTAAVVRRERWRFNYGRKMTPRRIAQITVPQDSTLRALITRQFSQTRQLIRTALRALGDDAIETRFNCLVEKWKSQRGPQSSISRMAMNPAYQQIIGMGELAVPLLLRQLESKVDHWFWALNAITGADPIPEEAQGKIHEMAKAWLRWGEENGYR